MKLLLIFLLNAVVSLGISLGVVYYGPGYALSAQETIWALNQEINAITKLSESIGNLVQEVRTTQDRLNKLEDGSK